MIPPCPRCGVQHYAKTMCGTAIAKRGRPMEGTLGEFDEQLQEHAFEPEIAEAPNNDTPLNRITTAQNNITPGDHVVRLATVDDGPAAVDDDLSDINWEDSSDDDAPNIDFGWIVDPIKPIPIRRTRRGHVEISQLPPFTGRVPGPINIPIGCASAVDYFSLFFNAEILNTFTQSTNSYYRNVAHKELNLNIIELKKFFACIFYIYIYIYMKVPVSDDLKVSALQFTPSSSS